MNTTYVQDQIVIDEDPHVIITGELKGDRVSIVIQSITGNLKINRHAHTKVMIQIGIKVHTGIAFFEVRIILMEGEEANRFCIRPGASACPLGISMFIKRYLITIPVHIIVCIVIITVIVIITLRIFLE